MWWLDLGYSLAVLASSPMGEGEELLTEQRGLQLRELAYGPVVRAAFEAEGLPPEWGMAFAYVESGFDPHAVNNTRGDAARGGAWGICQMTLLTARALGFKGKPQDLLDPAICAQYAAMLVKDDMRRVGHNFLDVAACYNGGRAYAHASPRARKYADFIKDVALRYASLAMVV